MAKTIITLTLAALLYMTAIGQSAEVNRVNRARIIMDLVKDGTVTTPANYQDTKVDYVSPTIALRYVDAIVAQTGGPINGTNHQKATWYLNQLKSWHRAFYVREYVKGEVATAETTARVASEAQVDTDIGVMQETARLTVADVAVAEDAGNLVFTITAHTADIADITVEYATSDGSAVQPGDYTSTSGTATITAGETTTTVSVPIVDDTDEESAEPFTITLSNPTNAEIAEATATGTINASDGS